MSLRSSIGSRCSLCRWTGGSSKPSLPSTTRCVATRKSSGRPWPACQPSAVCALGHRNGSSQPSAFGARPIPRGVSPAWGHPTAEAAPHRSGSTHATARAHTPSPAAPPCHELGSGGWPSCCTTPVDLGGTRCMHARREGTCPISRPMDWPVPSMLRLALCASPVERAVVEVHGDCLLCPQPQTHADSAARLRVSANKLGVPPPPPLVELVDLEARELGWADRPGTTLQFWAPWLRAGNPAGALAAAPAPAGAFYEISQWQQESDARWQQTPPPGLRRAGTGSEPGCVPWQRACLACAA